MSEQQQQLQSYEIELNATNNLRKGLLEKVKEDVMSKSNVDKEDVEMLLKVADSIDNNVATKTKLKQADKANQNGAQYAAILQEYLKHPVKASFEKVIEVTDVPSTFTPPSLPDEFETKFNPSEFDDSRLVEDSTAFMARMEKTK